MSVVQLVEQRIVVPHVVGSSPVRHLMIGKSRGGIVVCNTTSVSSTLTPIFMDRQSSGEGMKSFLFTSVAQLADAISSNPIFYGFESHQKYW